jgi:hypothetical protein
MTAREKAAIASLADELFKIGHAKELPDDEDERGAHLDFDLAFLFRAIPDLCEHNLAGLADFVLALLKRQSEDIHHHHAEQSVQ